LNIEGKQTELQTDFDTMTFEITRLNYTSSTFLTVYYDCVFQDKEADVELTKLVAKYKGY